MKYYSEITRKQYDSEKSCLLAEKLYQEQQSKLREELDKAVEEKKLKDAKMAEDKKGLVKSIEEAEARLREAKALNSKAKEQYNELIRKAQEEGNKILEASDDKIKMAAKERYELISQYNKKYGTYTRHINGEAAAVEFKDLFENWDVFWKNIFKW